MFVKFFTVPNKNDHQDKTVVTLSNADNTASPSMDLHEQSLDTHTSEYQSQLEALTSVRTGTKPLALNNLCPSVLLFSVCLLSHAQIRLHLHTHTADDEDDECSSRLVYQQRNQLPTLSTSSFWSKLATHLNCGEKLPTASACTWPFHSWFELQRLQFEGRLNKRLFQRLQSRSIRLHPSDPIAQKRELFESLNFSNATQSYSTAPTEKSDMRIKNTPVDQVLLYRAHLHAHHVRSKDNSISHKDLKLTLKEPLWTGNRRLFRKYGNDRFLFLTFDKHLLTCSPSAGCKVKVRGDAEANSTVDRGCERCLSLIDYLVMQLVGKESGGESAHVVLSLAGKPSTEHK